MFLVVRSGALFASTPLSLQFIHLLGELGEDLAVVEVHVCCVLLQNHSELFAAPVLEKLFVELTDVAFDFLTGNRYLYIEKHGLFKILSHQFSEQLMMAEESLVNHFVPGCVPLQVRVFAVVYECSGGFEEFPVHLFELRLQLTFLMEQFSLKR